ncbi:MAG: hypothetical protein LWW93_12030 [Hyphomicrobiales bacterium]|nr:hypothetical protein [Hyphomicrobiales bacterium]
MTPTKLSGWLDAIAATPDLPPAAIRIAIAIAANRSADLAEIVGRLGVSPTDAAAAAGALAAAGFVRTKLEPVIPSGAPSSFHLSQMARRALDVLRGTGAGHVETWRSAFAETMPEATLEARRKAWSRARLSLVAAGIVEIDGDGVIREVGR